MDYEWYARKWRVLTWQSNPELAWMDWKLPRNASVRLTGLLTTIWKCAVKIQSRNATLYSMTLFWKRNSSYIYFWHKIYLILLLNCNFLNFCYYLRCDGSTIPYIVRKNDFKICNYISNLWINQQDTQPDHDQQHCYHQASTVNQRLLLQLL
jgi:hypothetical protein